MARGQRLRELREGLGLSQTAFAELANSSKRAQIRYEKGDPADADYMAALAAAGLDVLYILTGQRAGSNASRATHLPNRSRATDLPPEQRALLDNYDACAPLDRAFIRKAAAAAAKFDTLTGGKKKPPRKAG